MKVEIDIPPGIWTDSKKIAESDKELLAEDINEVIEILLNTYISYGNIRNMGVDLEQGDSAWFDFNHPARYKASDKVHS
jgi:hypothetical protein